MIRALKAAAIAAVAAGGLTLGVPQDAQAQGFSFSVGRGFGPGYGYGYPGYGYDGYRGYGYGYPAYGYSSYGFRRGYVSPGFGYAYPSRGVRRWDNDWDRGDWRRLNRRLERRFDWDD